MATEDVELLQAQWRRALDAAEAALSGARVSLLASDLHSRGERLRAERDATTPLLRQLAIDRRGFIFFPMLLPPDEAQRRLRLPRDVKACVFGLDGVLVPAAEIHAEAWATTFDELLERRGEHPDRPTIPFDRAGEYWTYMHGRPRLDGIRAFLGSRGISLETGSVSDPAGTETVHGLANRKQELLAGLLEREGSRAYADTHSFLALVCDARLLTCVHSSSAHTAEQLEQAGLTMLVDARVDAAVVDAEGLRPRPAPDRILAACRLLGIPPAHVAAFDTGAAGIEAASAAGCRYVVAVERHPQHAEALRAAGADLVVTSLADLCEPAAANGSSRNGAAAPT